MHRASDAPLAAEDRATKAKWFRIMATFYAGEEKGYIDYPALA